MIIDAAFPSTYLKHSDLNGRHIKLVMSTVVMEDVGDDHKPVLYFQNAKKGLVLNKINSAAISAVYGQETDGWTGKQIEVYPDTTLFQGRPTPCIRVRAFKPAPPPPPQTIVDEHLTTSQIDDTIPF